MPLAARGRSLRRLVGLIQQQQCQQRGMASQAGALHAGGRGLSVALPNHLIATPVIAGRLLLPTPWP